MHKMHLSITSKTSEGNLSHCIRDYPEFT